MLSAQSAVVQPQDVINNDAGHRGIDIKSRGRWGTLKRLFLFCKPQHIRIFAGLSSLTLNSITNLYFPCMYYSAIFVMIVAYNFQSLYY